MSLVQVLILAVLSAGLDCQEIHAWDDPTLSHAECRKAACTYPSLCYIPHPADCFKFIMCKPLETGQIISQAMQCAFGTKWKPGPEPACDRYDLVDCLLDECKKPAVKAYFHPDGNCRTYWQCINGQSTPACCAKFHSFDPVTKNCTHDISCQSVCPLLNDATCGGGVHYAHFPDGNCRTHWDCENGHPHPVCCPDGQGFDVFETACVPNAGCKDGCPKEYSETCSRLGTISYDLVDGYCRTYMKCDKKGQADPFCCLPGLMYDPRLKKCVNGAGTTCVNENCPYGYKEECRLEAVPGRPHKYKNLDAFGGKTMPCAIGTAFNASLCQCVPDPLALALKPTPLVCTMAIDAQFPDLKNRGSAVAALLMIGEYGQGETGVGNMTSFWDGGAGINIPYYGTQKLFRMYLETRFRPTAGSTIKQVFVSSCEYIDGVPTFEVSMSEFKGNGGMIKVVAKTTNVAGMAEVSFPYNFNDELIFRVIYDGAQFGVFLDSNDPNMSNSAVRRLTGGIQIDISGLRFAHCRYEKNVSGFLGHVAEIKFTNCLTTEMDEALLAAAPIV